MAIMMLLKSCVRLAGPNGGHVPVCRNRCLFFQGRMCVCVFTKSIVSGH